jgi:hypothetical protein
VVRCAVRVPRTRGRAFYLFGPQVGFGPEHGIDNIGCYWFYCNASNGFGQKCLVCTTDLSHVTVFRRAKTLINGQAEIDESGSGRGSPLASIPPARLLLAPGREAARHKAVPVSGPAPLRQAAVDNVRRWQFEPKAQETPIDGGSRCVT